METNMEDMKKSIDDTNKIMNGRLDGIEGEVKKVNSKMLETETKNMEINKRMEMRLTALELKEQNENLDIQPVGRTEKVTAKTFNSVKNVENIERRGIEDGRVKKYGNKADVFTEAILSEPVGTFRSSWARNMENELRIAARKLDREDMTASGEEREAVDDASEKVDDTPDTWEDRWKEEPVIKNHNRKSTPIVRKPVVVKEWFGIESSSDESDSEQGQWTEVERRKRSKDKKLKMEKRRMRLKRECATRASNMIRIGPISTDSVEYFMKQGQNFEDAKVSAFKEFCQYNLNYSAEELSQMEVAETRLSTKGDNILNIALFDEDGIKELFVRRAESRNENITARCYIPPNFHECVMGLNRICTEKRKLDPSLRTQLQFGSKDVEVFTKYKGEDKGFRRVRLSELTDMSAVPAFNYNVKWKRYQDKPPRRINTCWEDPGQCPSTVGQILEVQPVDTMAPFMSSHYM